jgi:hypothetical protein
MRIVNWLAGKVLRRRRYVPLCPVARALASWAARTIGAKGRATANTNRRRAAAFAWADADEARRNFEHNLWMARNASTKPVEATTGTDTDIATFRDWLSYGEPVEALPNLSDLIVTHSRRQQITTAFLAHARANGEIH